MDPVLHVIKNVIYYITAAAQETENCKRIEAFLDAPEIEEMTAEYEPGKNEDILKPLSRSQQSKVFDQQDCPPLNVLLEFGAAGECKITYLHGRYHGTRGKA